MFAFHERPLAAELTDEPDSDMVAGDFVDEDYVDEHGPRHPRSWQLWIALGLLAFGVYEFTAQAPLSVTILCLKFGANDLATGWWLWRRDPWQARGRTCFWFYAALALAKVCGTALAACFVCIGLAVNQGNQAGQKLMTLVAEGGIVMVVACMAAALCVMVGVLLAWWGKVRVWVSSVKAADRQADLFPPPMLATNHADGLILCGVLTGIVVFVLAWVILGGACKRVLHIPQAGDGFAEALAVLAGVVAIIIVGFVAARRVAARHPVECWGCLQPETTRATDADGALGDSP